MQKLLIYFESHGCKVFGTWSLQKHLQPRNIPEKHSSQAKGIWDCENQKFSTNQATCGLTWEAMEKQAT
jgi:hypothetical protein